jgi:hypothetical protein
MSSRFCPALGIESPGVICFPSISGHAAISAMVRATLRVRSWARALKACCSMARSVDVGVYSVD